MCFLIEKSTHAPQWQRRKKKIYFYRWGRWEWQGNAQTGHCKFQQWELIFAAPLCKSGERTRTGGVISVFRRCNYSCNALVDNLCCSFPSLSTAFVHWSRQRPEHPWNDMPASFFCFKCTDLPSFVCKNIMTTTKKKKRNLTLISGWDKMISYYIKAGLGKTFRVNGHMWFVQLSTAPWQQRQEYETPLSCYRNLPPSVCLTHPHVVQELRGGVFMYENGNEDQ